MFSLDSSRSVKCPTSFSSTRSISLHRWRSLRNDFRMIFRIHRNLKNAQIYLTNQLRSYHLASSFASFEEHHTFLFSEDSVIASKSNILTWMELHKIEIHSLRNMYFRSKLPNDDSSSFHFLHSEDFYSTAFRN